MRGLALTQRVAILGSSGYIGSTLVRELRSRGIDTVATSRNSWNAKLRINVLEPGLAPKLKELGVTTVVDCSGSVPATTRNRAQSSHVAGTLNLTAQLGKSAIGLIHIATSLPQGTSDPKTQEYLRSKYMAESLVRDWLDSGRGNGTILKLDSIYGPRLPKGRFLCDCARAARSGESFRLLQPNARRGFTHERDLVEALVWILDGWPRNVRSVVLQPTSDISMMDAMEHVVAWVNQNRSRPTTSLWEVEGDRVDLEFNSDAVFRARIPFHVGVQNALEEGLGLDI